MTNKNSDEWHGCPIRYGAVIFGDNWCLLILRDLVFKGAKHYADFLNAGDGTKLTDKDGKSFTFKRGKWRAGMSKSKARSDSITVITITIAPFFKERMGIPDEEFASVDASAMQLFDAYKNSLEADKDWSSLIEQLGELPVRNVDEMTVRLRDIARITTRLSEKTREHSEDTLVFEIGSN